LQIGATTEPKSSRQHRGVDFFQRQKGASLELALALYNTVLPMANTFLLFLAKVFKQ
jgi:hypothetical protein